MLRRLEAERRCDHGLAAPAATHTVTAADLLPGDLREASTASTAVQVRTNVSQVRYYPQPGYTETHRAQQDGFHRVFSRKQVEI